MEARNAELLNELQLNSTDEITEDINGNYWKRFLNIDDSTEIDKEILDKFVKMNFKSVKNNDLKPIAEGYNEIIEYIKTVKEEDFSESASFL